MQQRRRAAPFPQERYGLGKLHLMIEFGEADDVAAATAAVAVEEILLRVHQQAGFVVRVQRTQSQEAAEADGPGLLPTMCLEILQEWNLLFEFIESGSIHGLPASIGRIRQTAPSSRTRIWKRLPAPPGCRSRRCCVGKSFPSSKRNSAKPRERFTRKQWRGFSKPPVRRFRRCCGFCPTPKRHPRPKCAPARSSLNSH